MVETLLTDNINDNNELSHSIALNMPFYYVASNNIKPILAKLSKTVLLTISILKSD